MRARAAPQVPVVLPARLMSAALAAAVAMTEAPLRAVTRNRAGMGEPAGLETPRARPALLAWGSSLVRVAGAAMTVKESSTSSC